MVSRLLEAGHELSKQLTLVREVLLGGVISFSDDIAACPAAF